MSKTTAAQLSFIEEPLAEPKAKRAERRRMSPALTAQHCNALLAQLDRVISDQQRIESLAQLFEAAERAAERAEASRLAQARASHVAHARGGQVTADKAQAPARKRA